MTQRFSALDAMIRDIVTKTQMQSDCVEVLTSVTRLVNASGADPCVVLGTLVEGIVTTVVEGVPPEQRADVAIETVRLLRDCFMERGAV